MKKALTLAAIPVLLAGAGFGTQWYAAQQLPSKIPDELKKFNEKNSKLLRFELSVAPNQVIEKGKPFTVLAKPIDKPLQMVFNEDDSPVKEGIPFKTVVNTGPFFFDKGFELASARTYATLDLDALKIPKEGLETITKAFDNKPPFEFNSTIPLFDQGSYKAVINPANFAPDDETKITYAGLNLTGTNANVGTYQYTSGAFDISSTDNKFKFHLTDIKGDEQRAVADKTTAKGMHQFGQMTLAIDEDPTKITVDNLKIDYDVAEAYIDNLYLGDFNINVPKLTVNVKELPQPVEAKLGLNLQAKDNSGNFIVGWKLAANDIKNLKQEPFELNNLTYNYTLDKLDSPTVEKAFKALKQITDSAQDSVGLYEEKSKLREKITKLDEKLADTLYEDNIDTNHANPEVKKLLEEYVALTKKIDEQQKAFEEVPEKAFLDVYNHVLKPKETTLNVNFNADNTKGKTANSVQLTYMGGLPQAANKAELEEKLSALQPEDVAKILKGDIKFALDKAILPQGMDMMVQPYIDAGLVKASDKEFSAHLALGDGKFNLNGTDVTFAELQQKLMSVNPSEPESDATMDEEADTNADTSDAPVDESGTDAENTDNADTETPATATEEKPTETPAKPENPTN